jgi:hypothetical protein
MRFVGLLALAACLALARPARAGSLLENRIKQTDHNASQRLLALAQAEEKAKHGALSMRTFARVVELDPDNSTARRELGWRKGPSGWTKAKDPDVPVPPKTQEEDDRAAKFLADEHAIEEGRAREIVKICGESGTPEEARPYLLALLERMPRMAEVHAALGHEKVGDRYVRPELLAMVKRQAEVEKRWGEVRYLSAVVEATTDRLTLEGAGDWPVNRVGERLVGAGYPDEDAKAAALSTARVQRLLRLLLGDAAKAWDPSPIYFLEPKQYEAFVKANTPDESQWKSRLRSASFGTKSAFALRAMATGVEDIYAHNVGYRTAQSLSTPKGADGKKPTEDEDHFAWLNEGFGYLMSLEISDTAGTSFYSTTESTAKVTGIPPPKVGDRKNYAEWIRALMARGEETPLRELLGKSINSLDLHASMEAWSFVRFLALYDPDGFRRLPDALSQQVAGSEPDRADEALRQAFGKGIEELQTLWRAYVLEVS